MYITWINIVAPTLLFNACYHNTWYQIKIYNPKTHCGIYKLESHPHKLNKAHGCAELGVQHIYSYKGFRLELSIVTLIWISSRKKYKTRHQYHIQNRVQQVIFYSKTYTIKEMAKFMLYHTLHSACQCNSCTPSKHHEEEPTIFENPVCY